MIKVIGVRFRRAGKVYYFNPLDMDITTGMHVIVETARGVEYGYVVLGVKDMDEEKVFQPLKPVIRIATPQDDAVADENRQKEKDAFKICQEKIAKHGLDMKLIDAEYTFDNNKVLFYFTADGRVDFRELVLVKVMADKKEKQEIIAIADIFRAKVVDVAANSLMIELTGNQNKLDAFLNLMADFEVLEMVRTGITGLGRGVSTLN